MSQSLRAYLFALAAACSAAAAAPLVKILPLGDSITYGCGSSTALPPSWPVSCGASAGGYRAPLYHMLRDTGFSDAAGNASFVFVGTQSSGPSDIAAEYKAHEGHPGWTIPQINGIAAKWVPLAPTFILVHLGTNDVGQGHNLSTMLADMTALLATIQAGVPGATTLVASIINMRSNDTNAVLVAYNAALPGLVAAAAAGGQKALFVDVNRRSGWCNGPTATFPCTGVHPTTGGYAGMAMAFFEVLGPLMPLPAAPAQAEQAHAYSAAWA